MNLRNHKLHELMNKKFQYLFYLLDSTSFIFSSVQCNNCEHESKYGFLPETNEICINNN